MTDRIEDPSYLGDPTHTSDSNPHSMRLRLLHTTKEFCSALISPPSPPALLKQFFRPEGPKITEHGPSWASSRLPFLGKTFSGVEDCIKYFQVLSEVLEMSLPEDAFPWADGFIVDAEAGESSEGAGKGMVSVVGKGTFKSKKTGKGWDEQFIYRFSEFDESGKIGHWEIWADPLSAWVAVGE
jgi:hypothetical protein